ncbi:hypothetical protein [Lysinibacillus fusiformis]|uniref:hypothetical protein n=1 Tax=Lysinibacillus fusiformis TaxID=28031 RepID=UPI003D028D80
MTTIEAYRIVVRDRESGEVVKVRTEYEGEPLTREAAQSLVAFEAAMWPESSTTQAVEPIPPSVETVAARWLADEEPDTLSGSEAVAAALRLLADRIEKVDPIIQVKLDVNLHVFAPTPAEEVRVVNAFAEAAGRTTSWTHLTTGGHQVRTGHNGLRVVTHLTDEEYASFYGEDESAGVETLRDFPCIPVHNPTQPGGPFCDNHLCKGACGRLLLIHGRATTDPEPTPAAGTARADIAGAGESGE